jgi:nondiscriminating aspartyl-tRNA synthetase
MRVLSNVVKDHIGGSVEIEGWLHKKRLLGGLTFINEKLRGMQIGTVLSVTGTAVEEQRAPGGAELHDPTLRILVAVTTEPPIEIDKPLSHKSDNLDTLFDYRHIGLRNTLESSIFKIRSELLRYIRAYLYEQDFVEINTPKLVAGAAEGGAEVFTLDYFGKQASLAQSPQLYKQIMVGVFERVFEIAPAFRAELSATTRHVSEVTMLDVEMGFIEGHDDVLRLVQDLLFRVLTQLYQEHQPELTALRAPKLMLTPEFPRYTMAEIHVLYQKATGTDMSQEIDLTPDEEKWICEYAKTEHGCEAVFATGLPQSKMKYYHMKGEHGTTRSADLLFRGIEISTVPQREHRYQELVAQMRAAGVDPDAPGFAAYVNAFKHGLPAHGGFGFGIDRLTEKAIGLGNVKEAILFPRDINRLAP